MIPQPGESRKLHPDVPSARLQAGLEAAEPEGTLLAMMAQLREAGKLVARLRQLAALSAHQTIIDQSCALELSQATLRRVVSDRIRELREDRAIAAGSLERWELTPLGEAARHGAK